MLSARSVAGLSSVVVLTLAPAAYGRDPGVSVNPNSPGGQEYAIPLDSARDQAQTAVPKRRSAPAAKPAPAPPAPPQASPTPAQQTPQTSAAGGGPAPSTQAASPTPEKRSGASATRRSSTTPKSSSGTSGSARSDAARGPKSAGAARASSASVPTAAAPARTASDDTVLILGIAAAVLVVGGLAGLAFRRRDRVASLRRGDGPSARSA